MTNVRVAATTTDPDAGPDGEVFARWLKARMRARHLSQGSLAAAAGVDQEGISQVLTGIRSPSRLMVLRLVTALGEAPPGVHLTMPLPLTGSPAESVLCALRSDPVLTLADIDMVFDYYRWFAGRTQEPRPTAGLDGSRPS